MTADDHEVIIFGGLSAISPLDRLPSPSVRRMQLVCPDQASTHDDLLEIKLEPPTLECPLNRQK